jgi:membrane-bound lytic murein transglycosylase B
MTRTIALLAALLPALLLAPLTAAANYANDARADRLYTLLQQRYGFGADDLAAVRKALAQAQSLPQLVATERNAKERTLTWDAYEPIHVNEANIAAGRRFLIEQHDWLARAEAEYGVPPQVIAAILGVETKYGRVTGRYRALDTLSTMAFEHPTRGDFFLDELAQLFVLCRDDHLTVTDLKSSYAGALGAAQFMPSNYRRLGVDFDGDGQVNLWSAPDAIGSIARYLTEYRPANAWRRGQPLFVKARAANALAADLPRNASTADLTVGALEQAGLQPTPALPPGLPAGLVELQRSDGIEYWVALPNFYSVMSYNPRVFYAAAVACLAQALSQPESAP